MSSETDKFINAIVEGVSIPVGATEALEEFIKYILVKQLLAGDLDPGDLKKKVRIWLNEYSDGQDNTLIQSKLDAIRRLEKAVLNDSRSGVCRRLLMRKRLQPRLARK